MGVWVFEFNDLYEVWLLEMLKFVLNCVLLVNEYVDLVFCRDEFWLVGFWILGVCDMVFFRVFLMGIYLCD